MRHAMLLAQAHATQSLTEAQHDTVQLQQVKDELKRGRAPATCYKVLHAEACACVVEP